MNPILRLALAVTAGIGVALCKPSSLVAWVTGGVAFFVVMASGSQRRRY